MNIQDKPDYKVFASEARGGEVTDFPNLERGWGETIDKTESIPPMEWFNAIGKRTDEWLLYLTQRGIPEWDSSLDYPKSSVVTHGDVIYISLRESKGEQPDRVQAAWSTLSAFLGLSNYATNEALNNGLALKLDNSAVVQTTGQSTTNVMSQKAVTDALYGVSQSWKDVTSKRSSGTTYTNSTGKPISVSLNQSLSDELTRLDVFVDDVLILEPYSRDGRARNVVTFTVPFGSLYRVVVTGLDIRVWAELS